MFSDFVKFISGNIGGFVDFFIRIFSNLLESVKLLGIVIKNNIIEWF